MYLADTEVKDSLDTDNNSQIRETKTPSSNSNPSQSSSPSCSTLLVIDDNSNSADSTIPSKNNIPIKPMPSTTAQTSHVPLSTTLPLPTHDITNGTAEQQRRRNSSIAKLLGGHPLNNHQYEEINQQILEDQSAQNVVNHSEYGTDTGMQRSRSSITRTLLMNSERTNSITKLPIKPPTSSLLSAPRDFEYLIRQELDKSDNDHSPATLQRNNSTSKVYQHFNSSNTTNAQSPTQSKLKRKRPSLKPPLPASNVPPFSLHEPFELVTSAANSIPPTHHSHTQNELLRFDSSKRPRHSTPQQYNLPMNPSTTDPSSYPYSNLNMNSSLYNQFNIHHDSVPSNKGSSPCNCSSYSHLTKLTLPSQVTHLSPSSAPPTVSHHNNNNNDNNMTMSPTRKVKSLFVRTDGHELPRQRSYSHTFNPTNSSLASSSEPSVPLKKRLLHAYNNEHRPTTPL